MTWSNTARKGITVAAMELISIILIPISICVAIFNSLAYAKNWQKGIFLYCILSFVWPLTRIGGIAVSYEILGFVFLLPAILGQLFSHRDFFLKKRVLLYEIFFALMIASTIISAVRHDASINYILIFAYFRINVLLLILLQKGMINSWLGKFFDFLVPVNFIVCIIQVYVPKSYLLFCELYVKRSDVVNLIVQNNERYGRLQGTFPVCTQLAIFSLMATALYAIRFLFKNNGPRTLAYLTMSIITGVGAACKTYFLGATVLLAYLACGILVVKAINKIKNRRVHFLRRMSLKKSLQVLVSVAVIAICINSFSETVAIKFYFDASFKNIGHSLEVRFSGLSSVSMAEPRDNKVKSAYARIGNGDIALAAGHGDAAGGAKYAARRAISAAGMAPLAESEKRAVIRRAIVAARFGSLSRAAVLAARAGSIVAGGTTISMVASLDALEKLIGVGATTPYDEFVGDSEMLMFYHYAGLLGVALVAVWLLGMILKSLRRLQVDSVIYIALIILGSTGVGMISGIMGNMILAYVITNLNSNEWRDRLFAGRERDADGVGGEAIGRARLRVSVRNHARAGARSAIEGIQA